MINIKKPIPFVLTSTNHGVMIVNRNDYFMVNNESGYGVGHQLLNTSSFDQQEIDFALALIYRRKVNFGEGVVAIDCGANIGVHSVEWARLMTSWGSVIAFEAQEKIFYALAGNIILNNCLNVTARNSAVGASCGFIEIPEPNYLIPSSYGSFELQKKQNNEYIGQEINYKNTKKIPLMTIDSLNLERLDFMKIDVEGMEEDVLEGSKDAISKFKPIMIIEIIKSNKDKLLSFLEPMGYFIYPLGINLLAIHKEDPVNSSIKIDSNGIRLD